MSVDIEFVPEGFDEWFRDSEKIQKKYKRKAVMILNKHAANVRDETEEHSPTREKYPPDKSPMLKPSWKLKKTKKYQNETILVSRIQSTAPHAHLIEDGHRTFRNTKAEYHTTGEKIGKMKKWKVHARGKSAFELGEKGIFQTGFVDGQKMLANALEKEREAALEDMRRLLGKAFDEFESS